MFCLLQYNPPDECHRRCCAMVSRFMWTQRNNQFQSATNITEEETRSRKRCRSTTVNFKILFLITTPRLPNQTRACNRVEFRLLRAQNGRPSIIQRSFVKDCLDQHLLRGIRPLKQGASEPICGSSVCSRPQMGQIYVTRQGAEPPSALAIIIDFAINIRAFGKREYLRMARGIRRIPSRSGRAGFPASAKVIFNESTPETVIRCDKSL